MRVTARDVGLADRGSLGLLVGDAGFEVLGDAV
jgi:hypothetical protein